MYDQKNGIYFSLDFKTMSTKQEVTEVLSLDLKKSPVYFHWNFPISWRAITNFGVLRELDQGENDVKDSVV